MSVVDAALPQTHAPALRRLYLARFGFAVVWAALFAATSSSPLGTFAYALAVTYPAFDLAAAVVDARTAAAVGRSASILYLNMAFSLAAVVALTVVGKDIEKISVVWGIWAVTAGAVQLVVALGRKTLGGQWPMIFSGGLSVLAGATFIAMARDATSLSNISGYALLGGIFFLVSAVRLGRRAAPRTAGA